MLQPIMKLCCNDYEEQIYTEPCRHIEYSGICKENYILIPDGCVEKIQIDNGSRVLTDCGINNRIRTCNYKGSHIYGIRLEVGYDFDEIGRIVKKPGHPLTDFMINQIIRSRGSVTVIQLAAMLCYSERHINNLFKERLGFGPKDFCRYIRFQNALLAIEENPKRNNSEFIEGLCYSDQAHFQREFKSFTGMTPRHYIEKSTG